LTSRYFEAQLQLEGQRHTGVQVQDSPQAQGASAMPAQPQDDLEQPQVFGFLVDMSFLL
jgi:hypothetical protein